MQIDDDSALQKSGVSFDDLLKAAFAALRISLAREVEKQVRLRTFDPVLISEIVDDARFTLGSKMTRHLMVQQPVSAPDARKITEEQISQLLKPGHQQARQDAGQTTLQENQRSETAGSAAPSSDLRNESSQMPKRVVFPTRKP